MKRLVGYIIGPMLLIVLLIGTTYSYFNYYKEEERDSNLIAGEMYVKLSGEAPTLSILGAYPRTTTEARSRNDNYVDFTILGKNTSLNEMINYSIQLTDGEAISGKTPINPNYLVFDLSMIDNENNETILLDAVKYDAFNAADLSYYNNIPINTTNQVSTKYRLRMWISEEVSISDTEEATYTSEEFSNLYANVSLVISTALTKRSLPMSIVSARKSDISDEASYFVTRISNNYLLTEAGDSLTDNDTVQLEITNNDGVLYFLYSDDKGNSDFANQSSLTLNYSFSINESFNIQVFMISQSGAAVDTTVHLRLKVNNVIVKEYNQLVSVVASPE